MKTLIILPFIVLFTAQVSAQGWQQVTKSVAFDRGSDEFGYAVSISGNTALVGAYRQGGNGGAAYLFEKSGNCTWNFVQKILQPIQSSNDRFGYSVGISGDHLIVGAYVEDEDEMEMNTIVDAGSAYIFEKDSNGTWFLADKIVASDRANGDYFGWSSAISGDYAIVGAHWEDHDTAGGNYMQDAGAAYIYERDSSGSWNQSQKVVASIRSAFNEFGGSVSISGNYAIVGAKWQFGGLAFIFERDGSGNWNEVERIGPAVSNTNDYFGGSVSISRNTALIGANGEDEDADDLNFLNRAGSAYIFDRDSAGNWNQTQKIVASDRKNGREFGHSVSISGNFAVVGAFKEYEDEDGGDTMVAAGSAYVFMRDVVGNWNEVQKVVAADRDTSDSFGWSVAISGGNAIAGAPYEQEDSAGGNTIVGAGSAYLFSENATDTIDQTSCSVFEAPSGNHTWDSSGTYTDTLTNWVGCDSIISINLTISTVDTGITAAANVLSANATPATYQWLDCNLSDAAIPAETNRSFTATASGRYAVEITENGCVDTSACYLLTVGILNNDFGSSLKVYPNPSSGRFTVDLGNTYEDVSIRISDVAGRLQSTSQVGTKQLFIVDLVGPVGFYMIEISTKKDKSASLKVLKEYSRR